MNEEAAGCYGCMQVENYAVPPSVYKVYGPVDELLGNWSSLDGLQQGVVISGVLLFLVFAAVPFLSTKGRKR